MVSRNPVGSSKFHGSSTSDPQAVATAASIFAGPILTNYAANMYSNKISMDYYTYRRNAYERQLADWNKYVGSQGKVIQYPELSYEGGIAASNLGINQAIASAYRNTASTEQSLGYTMGVGYRASRSLYGRSTGRSSRYL